MSGQQVDHEERTSNDTSFGNTAQLWAAPVVRYEEPTPKKTEENEVSKTQVPLFDTVQSEPKKARPNRNEIAKDPVANTSAVDSSFWKPASIGRTMQWLGQDNSQKRK